MSNVMAKLKGDYKIAINGTHVKTFKAGKVVGGRVAEAALQDGKAEKVKTKPVKTKPADGPKVKK